MVVARTVKMAADSHLERSSAAVKYSDVDATVALQRGNLDWTHGTRHDATWLNKFVKRP